MGSIRNAIVVMFDSWQYNYTGCYGNDWIKTPHIDKFAREGIVFENAYGNNMPTLPVRRSMMTGRYTLHDTGWGPLRPADTTVADLCWGSGVDTAMAYNTLVMNVGKAGFARSFNRTIFSHGYDNYFYKNDDMYSHYCVEQFVSDPGFLDRLRALPDGRQIEAINRAELSSYLRDRQHWESEDDQPVAVNIHNAIRLLEEADRNHNLLLWIDSWDPHEPWDPPSVWNKDMACPYDPDYRGADMILPPMSPVADLYTEEQMHHVRMLYAEKITLCDTYFGKLLACIRRLGLWDNTLVWLCSDHGEPLGNGEHGHGIMTKCRPWPYEELVHVPLILKAPGLPAGRRIRSFVQDCDCAPTLLDWLGLPLPEQMTGKSLLPLCRGEVDKVRDFAVAGYYGMSWSIITEDWSYIHWLNKFDGEDASMAALNELYDGAKSKYTDKPESAAEKEYRKQRNLDGEEQWTCTPGARVDLPQGDELYYRKEDRFQLRNVLAQHPDKAEELYRTLRLFMSDLKVM